MIIIILFILILNIVSILLMYRCLVNSDKKEKLIFIAAGTALMYILTSIVYWISTKGIEITEVSQTGKDLIIFAFVPVNGIIVLPLFAKSFTKFKSGGIRGDVLRNRGIALGVILLILLVLECIYFKNIQKQVVSYIQEQYSIQSEQEQNENLGSGNELSNELNANANELTNTETIQGAEENIVNVDEIIKIENNGGISSGNNNEVVNMNIV